MTWQWTWEVGGVYMLQPTSTDLSRCGIGNTSGLCCFEAGTTASPHVTLQLCDASKLTQHWQLAQNGSVVSMQSHECMTTPVATPTPAWRSAHTKGHPKRSSAVDNTRSHFAGFAQIALTPTASWGCSQSSDPPGQCCLPVPGTSTVPGSSISGCHTDDESRWHYNQFFAIDINPSNKSTFRLALKGHPTQCAVGKGSSFTAATCSSTDSSQLWSVIPTDTATGNANGESTTSGALLRHEASNACVYAANAHEAGGVAMGPCTPSPDNVWSPLCEPEGSATVAGWPCVGRTPSPSPSPSPQPHPHPSPPPAPPSSHGQIVTAPCNSQSTVGWQQFEGFWMVTKQASAHSTGTRRSAPGTGEGHARQGQPSLATGDADGPGTDGQCLKLNIASFCEGTVCPFNYATNFTAGMGLTTGGCVNGDRAQLMAAYTLPTPTDPRYRENFIPLTWAVSAYVGNGLVGARVQSEEGGLGVVHVLIDNVKLGALGKRKPNGYFRFTIADPSGGPYTVQLHQSIHNSVLYGNVTAAAQNNGLVSNFTIFVNADLDLPVVVLQCDQASTGTAGSEGRKDPAKSWSPSLEWVDMSKGSTDFKWMNTTSIGRKLVAFASVQAQGDTPAALVVAQAAKADLGAMLQRHTKWWQAYWSQSFITVPVTRVEAMYYVQMYRFPASDRVVLQGLMGAFGPTDNYNLWPDDVWDMNEQVMYWIGAASNRPEISNPMETWFEHTQDKSGGQSMTNYIPDVL